MNTDALAIPESKTLFSICDDLQTYFDTLEMIEGQLAEAQTDEDRTALERDRSELRAALDRIGGELSTKTDSIAGVLRRMAVEEEFLESEEKRLRGRRKTCERAEKWLRDYVLRVMSQQGITQLKTPDNTIFVRGSEAVIVTDVEKVPAEYQNAEVKMPLWLWLRVSALAMPELPEVAVLRVNAEASISTIKKAIKSGGSVPGADLEFRSSLVLR